MKEEDLLKLVPDKYDIAKITIFLGILLVAFFVGYTLKEVYVCKAWYKEQLYLFDLQENRTLWDLFKNLSNATITAGR